MAQNLEVHCDNCVDKDHRNIAEFSGFCPHCDSTLKSFKPRRGHKKWRGRCGDCEFCTNSSPFKCSNKVPCDDTNSSFKPKQTKVVNINGEPSEQMSSKAAIKMMKQGLQETIELINFQATLTRARYLALLKENFTEEQALIICSKQTLTGGM